MARDIGHLVDHHDWLVDTRRSRWRWKFKPQFLDSFFGTHINTRCGKGISPSTIAVGVEHSGKGVRRRQVTVAARTCISPTKCPIMRLRITEESFVMAFAQVTDKTGESVRQVTCQQDWENYLP